MWLTRTIRYGPWSAFWLCDADARMFSNSPRLRVDHRRSPELLSHDNFAELARNTPRTPMCATEAPPSPSPHRLPRSALCWQRSYTCRTAVACGVVNTRARILTHPAELRWRMFRASCACSHRSRPLHPLLFPSLTLRRQAETSCRPFGIRLPPPLILHGQWPSTDRSAHVPLRTPSPMPRSPKFRTAVVRSAVPVHSRLQQPCRLYQDDKEVSRHIEVA